MATSVDILTCARLCQLVYLDESRFVEQAARIGVNQMRYVAIENHVGAVALTETAGYLVFRGTDDRRDWRDNLNTLWRSSPSGSVHRGFLRALDALWPSLGSQANSDRSRGWCVTGHSLGGAIATLAAMRLCEGGHRPSVITFGQPAVGASDFARNYEREIGGRHLRFVHCLDIVPDAPVLAHHVGREMYFNSSGLLVENQSFLTKLRDAARRGWTDDAFTQIKDHSMERYVSLVEAIMPPRTVA